MALSNEEKQFLIELKWEWVSKEDAIVRLNAVREKIWVSSENKWWLLKEWVWLFKEWATKWLEKAQETYTKWEEMAQERPIEWAITQWVGLAQWVFQPWLEWIWNMLSPLINKASELWQEWLKTIYENITWPLLKATWAEDRIKQFQSKWQWEQMMQDIENFTKWVWDLLEKHPALKWWLELWSLWYWVELWWWVISWVSQTSKQILEKWWQIAWKTAQKLETSATEWFRQQAEAIALPTLKELWKKQRWDVARDVVETWGIWPFKKEEIIRTPKEWQAIEEITRLLKEWKIKPNMTEVQQLKVVWDEIEWLAKSLDARLKWSGITFTKEEINTNFNKIKQELIDSPILVWPAESTFNKLSSQIEKIMPKWEVIPAESLW